MERENSEIFIPILLWKFGDHEYYGGMQYLQIESRVESWESWSFEFKTFCHECAYIYLFMPSMIRVEFLSRMNLLKFSFCYGYFYIVLQWNGEWELVRFS